MRSLKVHAGYAFALFHLGIDRIPGKAFPRKGERVAIYAIGRNECGSRLLEFLDWHDIDVSGVVAGDVMSTIGICGTATYIGVARDRFCGRRQLMFKDMLPFDHPLPHRQRARLAELNDKESAVLIAEMQQDARLHDSPPLSIPHQQPWWDDIQF